MSVTAEKLYQLLPAFYRLCDSEQGEPLKALMDLIAREAGILDSDINRLYENWFIETCDEWVVPYLGDLLGVRGLHPVNNSRIFSQRAYVANTLSYRRRKGTAPILEQLAFDITGWRARVVEFFQLLAATQNVNHIRLHSTITPDLRRMNQLDLLDTAFDTISHNVDVRRISTGLGKHNIPNIGLFLWRLQSYPINRCTACVPATAPAGCYTFSRLGYDSHLFNRPQSEKQIIHLAEEINVPGLLRSRALYDELEALRQALAEGKTPIYKYFGPNDTTTKFYPSVFKIYLNGSETHVPFKEICICNLEDWRLPQPPITAAVDPVLGRLAFAKPAAVSHVRVSYSYGFSSDVGGGPYDRQESVSKTLTRQVTWQVGVSKVISNVAGETIFDNLTDAVDEWNNQPDGSVGVITIMDNDSYDEDLTGSHLIKVPEGSQLLIVAADWPVKDVPDLPLVKHRATGDVTPDELRPHVKGSIEVEGTAASDSLTGGELVLDGLLVEGGLTVIDGNLGSLKVSHCTLVPPLHGLEVNPQNERLNIQVTRSICGSLSLTAAAAKLLVDECIIDHGSGLAISAGSTPAELQRSTIFGSVEALKMEASNCIFNGVVDIQRRQTGCIRFSYLPVTSHTPRRFRCQPDLEIKTQIAEAGDQNILTQAEKYAIRDGILEWLFPSFASTKYGHHAYTQLSRACPLLIKTGSDDGSEMGVFNQLKQPPRETNLRTALDEYLPLGLETGIIYVT
jgi:hypothetical protein